MAEQVFNFQEKVEDLLVVEEQLDVDVRSLETCPYSATTLADILAKVQHAIDDLSLRQYSNLHVWVNHLDHQVSFLELLHFDDIFRTRKVVFKYDIYQQVEKNLAARLQAGVQAWTDALEGKKKDIDLSMDTDAPTQPIHKPGGEPQVYLHTCEISIAIYFYILYCLILRFR